MPGGIQLREAQESDLPVFFVHQRDPEALSMAAFKSRDCAESFARWAGILANPLMGTRTVAADAAVAGKVVCFERSGLWLVGYGLGREQGGRSIPAEAPRLSLNIVPTRALHALLATHIFVSIHVLQECEFVACTAPALPEYGLGEVSRDQTDECCMVLSGAMEGER